MLEGSSSRGRTVKNWPSEIAQELQERILLLGSQLIPARLPPPPLNLRTAQAGLHIRLEPFQWRVEAFAAVLSLCAPPVPLGREAIILFFISSFGGFVALVVGGDEADEAAVFLERRIVIGDRCIAAVFFLDVAVLEVAIEERHGFEEWRLGVLCEEAPKFKEREAAGLRQRREDEE